jgi:signal transduction histidine kinase
VGSPGGSVVEQQASETPWLFWIDLGLGLLSFLLVHLRRRWPLAIALIITAFAAVSALEAGPAVLAAVSLATRRRLPEIVAVGALVSGLVNFQLYDEDGLWWVRALLSVVFVAAQLGWGMYLGSRRELMWTLHQRAERAEAEQSLRAAQARATERARIAREMHDALAHRISQVSMHAGALAYRTDLGADELRAGAADIQRQANQALTDLRGVLGVLRDPGTADVPDPPQPTSWWGRSFPKGWAGPSTASCRRGSPTCASTPRGRCSPSG